ncbi:MAG: hypothetical protein COT71_01880 [Candidatus Andersenbacteria bacterium CG10_big_fil_rev_8_21_14_0_10_54_11]|uniref:Uncharacterized protein n=1 Tax=Candidatus Andersenbacteria bacterium CG10_big_fil_rev_8_21_14_0_10_54_11 TaxID=1974485 RepID=A0A2M6WZN8_9BACT|nr:MAG: hypothetical protein COT71_01880 [Candidatus Andersenbacteria bacterium CG10_big_fil_rev_8_21_14_0_10_54_11]
MLVDVFDVVLTVVLILFATAVGVIMISHVHRRDRGRVIWRIDDLPDGDWKILARMGFYYVVHRLDEKGQPKENLPRCLHHFEDINGTCFVKGRNEKRFSIQPYHACVETEPDELIAILEPVPEEEAPAAFRKPIPETGDDVW